jgi:hypothetical protein
MRAYDLAMTLIFVNCAFPILDAMGLTTLHAFSGSFTALNWFSSPLFTVAGFPINGITALAGALAAGTIVLLQSNLITDRGMAVIVFATVFWGSILISLVSISGIIMHFAGFAILYSIFLLACTLIFFNALIQFPTGGQGAHI